MSEAHPTGPLSLSLSLSLSQCSGLNRPQGVKAAAKGMAQYQTMTDEMLQQVVRGARMTDQAVKRESAAGSQGPPAEPVRGPPATNAVGWRGVPYGFGMSPEQAAPVCRTVCHRETD